MYPSRGYTSRTTRNVENHTQLANKAEFQSKKIIVVDLTAELCFTFFIEFNMIRFVVEIVGGS